MSTDQPAPEVPHAAEDPLPVPGGGVVTGRDGLCTPVQEAQQRLADALTDRLRAHADKLNAAGCPPVRYTDVLDLWAHVRRYQTPELDPVAARLVMYALDLGWRPTTSNTDADALGTPSLLDETPP